MAAATATLCSLFYDVCFVLLCNERKAAYHESPTDIIHAISWIITLNDGARGKMVDYITWWKSQLCNVIAESEREVTFTYVTSISLSHVRLISMEKWKLNLRLESTFSWFFWDFVAFVLTFRLSKNRKWPLINPNPTICISKTMVQHKFLSLYM